MRDKIDKLRMGLQLVGTGDNAYWTSWVVSAMAVLTVLAIEMLILGKYVYQFKAFVGTPNWVLFLHLFCPLVVLYQLMQTKQVPI